MPSFLLPRYLDGRGLAWLMCSDEAAERFRFAALPPKYSELNAWLDGHEEDLPAPRHSDRSDTYRIAVPGQWASGGAVKVRFRLGKRTPKATLQVIAQHLDEEEIPWLFFTTADGTRLQGQRMSTHRLLQQIRSPKGPPRVNA